MTEATINGNKFEFFESISEISIERYHQYSRYMLVASGIGDSLADVDEHLGKILRLMTTDIKKAHQEVKNLRQNLYMVQNQLDLRFKGFMFLTNSVNGEKWEDFSDAGIEKLYAMIKGESLEHMAEVMQPIISGIDEALERYFPSFYDDASDKNRLSLARKRALLLVDEIVNENNHKEELKELDESIFRYYKPKDFENDKAVVEFDKNFEEMCLFLSKEFGGEIKNKSVMEFYSAYNILVEQNKKIKTKRRK